MRPSKKVDGAVGGARVARVVRHHADGRAAAVQVVQQLDDRFAVGRVEVAGRLVGEQDEGLTRQRSGDRDALLLTAGQLARKVFRAVRHADLFQRFVDARLSFRAAQVAIRQGQFHVLVNVQIADQVEALKDEPDFAVADVRPLREREIRTGLPLSQYCPSLAESSRPRIESSVDLPQPDGPVIETYSPC
jgi:hypothetical protein